MFVTINVSDSFKKGQTKAVTINLNQIAALEAIKAGTFPMYRVILSTPGSATPPKADDKYPKSFFEPYAYLVSESQYMTLMAHIGSLKPIVDLCVDAVGSASPAATPVPSGLSF